MNRFGAVLTCLAMGLAAGGADIETFFTKPYLQLGEKEGAGALTLVWETESSAGEWNVEVKSKATKPSVRPLVIGSSKHFLYQAVMDGLKPGEVFKYRVLHAGKQVFEAEAHAPVAKDASFKFAVFGDCGADTAGQREVAAEAYKFRPDLVFIPGDIVYLFGLAGEYHSKFFPIYNADQADAKVGAPLMRSTVFTAAPGNHDVAGRNLGLHPEGLAYFYYWSQPLNGLPTFERPGFKASSSQMQAFKDASGEHFPRMSNFWFTYGNTYWLILDSNPDIDWSQPDLAQWVGGELASAAAKDATWRFVGFHHPGFNSSHAHAGDQQMRVLSKTFEDGHVDVVLSGHVHNYQRTFPMKFKLGAYDASKNHRAAGEWILDKEFDGKSRTKASGVVYLISGAGGAMLYDKGQGADRNSWQEFTTQFVSDVHSFTAASVEGTKLSFRQVDEQGKTVDQFVMTK